MTLYINQNTTTMCQTTTITLRFQKNQSKKRPTITFLQN